MNLLLNVRRYSQEFLENKSQNFDPKNSDPQNSDPQNSGPQNSYPQNSDPQNSDPQKNLSNLGPISEKFSRISEESVKRAFSEIHQITKLEKFWEIPYFCYLGVLF